MYYGANELCCRDGRKSHHNVNVKYYMLPGLKLVAQHKHNQKYCVVLEKLFYESGETTMRRTWTQFHKNGGASAQQVKENHLLGW